VSSSPDGDEPAPSGGRSGEALRAFATPDDGHRLVPAPCWDEAARPTGPPPDPDRLYADDEQLTGRHLIAVHDHLRSELQALRSLVAGVLDGGLGPRRARERLAAMSLRQNEWAMGAYCAAYCRMVTMHHGIEDRAVFPHLRQFDSRLAPVVGRLEEDHGVIHGLIEHLDRALAGYTRGEQGGEALSAAVDSLTDALRSHLSYEERELVEPLARWGFF
jgi:hypothetical protein